LIILDKKKKRLDFFLVLFTLDAAALKFSDFCNVKVNIAGVWL